MTRAEYVTLGGALHATLLHVQERYLKAWERYCTHYDRAVRNDAGATYCRLKDAWKRLEAAYERLIAIGGAP